MKFGLSNIREKSIKFYNYISPCSWFEISQIKYDQGNIKETKKCLKKVSSSGSFFGDGLISHRVNLMHEKIKSTKIDSSEIKS